jgi:hypothetical protein
MSNEDAREISAASLGDAHAMMPPPEDPAPILKAI